MFSAIHSALANSRSRTVRRTWEVLHRPLSRAIDPEVRIRIGGRRLTMKFSHPLPFMLSRFPYYDTLMPRLAQALGARHGDLRIIDVGANIGDTASLTLDAVDARILAIEPDPDYFRLPQKNTRECAGVTCVCAALAEVEADGAGGVALTKVAGTAFIAKGGGVTLDGLLATQPDFARAQLLKVDTDGFDYKVLKGARRFLAATKAAVFFELAPEHCEKVGRVDPLEIFAFLRGLGYATFMFYHNEGWLTFSGGPDDGRVFDQLVQYARTKGHYYDVLALHSTEADFAATFLAAERQIFRPAEHAYLNP